MNTTTQLPITRALRGARAGLAEQLAARLAERIEQRLLAPGARLPSVRDAATRHGVSPSTVVGAYDLLQARGLVVARPQRGFFVRDAAAEPARRSPPAAAPPDRPSDCRPVRRRRVARAPLQRAASADRATSAPPPAPAAR